MKILFISDIHGLDTNINIIEDVIKNENINMLVCLGDIYNPYYSINVKDFLNNHKDILLCMRGNCDSYDNDSDFEMYDGLKSIKVDGLDLYLNHGHEYNIDKGIFNGNILIYGHKHTPYIKQRDNKIYICVGSLSLPRDDNGASYMIYNDREFTIYDIDKNVIDGIKI